MRLYSFRAVRYSSANPQAGELAAPPFDQINDRLRDRLQQVPFQFAHLTRPVAGDGLDPYRHSAQLHRSWLAAGVLEQDSEPALYPYAIELPSGEHRLGMCGLVGIEPPGSDMVRPHERTLVKTISDRLDLLRATDVDLEPVMLLTDDGGHLDRMLAADRAARQPLVAHHDADGNRHLLYRVAEPDRVRAYQELLAPLPALIADGHHRYRVAQLHAEEIAALPGTAAAGKLAVLISLASPTLSIDPIHRALAAPLDLEALAPLARGRRRWNGRDGAELAAEVAAAPQPSLAIWQRGGDPEVWHLDPDYLPSHLPAAAGRLAVVQLHESLLPHLGFEAAAATDGTVIYRARPEELAQELAEGSLAVGIWLPPMRGEDFAAAIAHGDLLPPKSTRFMPKLASGLAWSPHGSEVR